MKNANTSSSIKQLLQLLCTPFTCVLLVILINLSLISCNKKNNTPAVVEAPQVQNSPSQTLAPVPTTTLMIDSMNTNLKITNISTLSPTYISSFPRVKKYYINLDGDSTMDISFIVTEGWVHGGGLLENKTIDVETLNNNTYILTDSVCTETAYLNCNPSTPGNQISLNKVFPKPLDDGDKIDITTGKWNKGLIFLYFYQANIDTTQCYTSWLDGPWYTFSKPKYIAIKCNGKPCWIKCQVTFYGGLVLHKFAIVKN